MLFISSKKFSFSRHSTFRKFSPFLPQFPDSKGQIKSGIVAINADWVQRKKLS